MYGFFFTSFSILFLYRTHAPTLSIGISDDPAGPFRVEALLEMYFLAGRLKFMLHIFRRKNSFIINNTCVVKRAPPVGDAVGCWLDPPTWCEYGRKYCVLNICFYKIKHILLCFENKTFMGVKLLFIFYMNFPQILYLPGPFLSYLQS